MRAWSLFLVVLVGCEGQVGEPGDVGGAQVVIRDRSGPELVDFSCAARAVVTRAPLSCGVLARHPTNSPLRCTLDGVELGDCSTTRETVLRFESPGARRVTVVVVDAEERSVSGSLAVEVTGLPNQPPTVTGLAAAVNAGITPLRTALTWSALDPEGDLLRCAIDIGADGSIENADLDCAAFQLELRAVGSTPVKVIATDPQGLTGEQTITLTVNPPTADLRIDKVEFGQSVMKSDLKLVADKPALLRVTVLANEAALSAPVEVEALQGTTVLGKQRLVGPTVIPQAATPGDLTKSFRLPLPAEWVKPGLSLRIAVDPEDALGEVDESNNERVIVPQVGRANVLHLTQVPVVSNGLTGRQLDVKPAVTGLWPVKDVELKLRAPYTFTGTISAQDTAGWSSLLSQLSQLRSADGSRRAYYGLVRASFGGGVAGIGYVGQTVATGRDDSATVAAHELGHNFGLNHAPCGGAGGPDANYPYAGGKIGSWGFNGTQLLSPTQYVDVMTYCTPTWVSDYNYARVQRNLEGNQYFDPDVVLASFTPEDAVLISGRLVGAGGALNPVYRLRAPVSPVVDDGDTRLRLVAADGSVRVVPVELQVPAEGDELHFAAVVPWSGPLARVELLRGGQVVLSRQATASSWRFAASVEQVDSALIRVRWPAGVSATVAHLGAERTTLAIGATGGEVLLRTDGLDGARYEVSLSDGLRTERGEITAGR